MLAGLVAAALWANGYYVGLDDHAIHLVFLERTRDAGFLPGDLLADAAPHHASFFWILQAPLVDLIGVEALYVVVHVLSWLAMFAGLAAMARALAPQLDRRHVAWLACVPAVMAPLTFGGIVSFDALMLNRTVVIGGELAVLALAARGRGVAALALAGALANLHATTALHTAVLAGALLLLRPDRWRLLAVGGAACALAAAPLVLLVLLGHRPPSPPLPYEAWRTAVEIHYPFHHFVGWWGIGDAVALLIPTVAILSAFRHTRERAWLALLAAAYGLGVANAIATEVLHLRLGTLLHLYEVGRLLTYVGLAAAAVVYLQTRASPPRHRLAGVVLALAVLGHAMWSQQWEGQTDLRWGLIAMIAGIALLLPERTAARRAALPWLGSIAPMLLAVAALYTHHLRGRFASIALTAEDAALARGYCDMEVSAANAAAPRPDLCGVSVTRWARANLPPTARVSMPPYFMHPLVGFRTSAYRSTLVTFKDGGESTFDDGFARAWMERMSSALGGPPELPPRRSSAFWGSLWGRVEQFLRPARARVERQAARFGVTHLLCERHRCGPLPWPKVYEDGAFEVWAVSARAP